MASPSLHAAGMGGPTAMIPRSCPAIAAAGAFHSLPHYSHTGQQHADSKQTEDWGAYTGSFEQTEDLGAYTGSFEWTGDASLATDPGDAAGPTTTHDSVHTTATTPTLSSTSSNGTWNPASYARHVLGSPNYHADLIDRQVRLIEETARMSRRHSVLPTPRNY
jgi:hypothetical protein